MRRGAILAGEFHHAIEPPDETLLRTDELVALRLHGRPRDPESGQHEQVAIFARADVTARRLARHLREAADALELSET